MGGLFLQILRFFQISPDVKFLSVPHRFVYLDVCSPISSPALNFRLKLTSLDLRQTENVCID